MRPVICPPKVRRDSNVRYWRIADADRARRMSPADGPAWIYRTIQAVLAGAFPAGPEPGVAAGAAVGAGRGSADRAGAVVGAGPGSAEAEDAPVVAAVGLRAAPADAGVRAALAEMWAQAGARRDRPLTVRVEQHPSQRVAVLARDVAGYGWAAWTPGPLGVAGVEVGDEVDGTCLTNGLIRVRVDPGDGTFALGAGGPGSGSGGIGGTAGPWLSGLGRLVDDGDEGDTYNYSPPASDVVIDRPVSVDVEVVERGPVRGRLRVVRRYRWPERIVAGARTGEREVEVATDLELRAGEELVRVTTTVDNQCRDHRLRAWFPLPAPAQASVAECAFGLVERGLTAEGGPHELGLPTFPSRRFVSAGGLTLLHEGLPEYQLVDEGRALAVTLLRATGMLSRDRMAYRSNAAGPALPVEGPQMIGHQVLRYCVHAGQLDPYALADQAWLPLEVALAPGGGDRPRHGQLLSVSGAEVSALHRAGNLQVSGGHLELRVFNPSDRSTTVRVEGHSGWLVDLLGRPQGSFDGAFPLAPHAIATVRVSPAACAAHQAGSGPAAAMTDQVRLAGTGGA